MSPAWAATRLIVIPDATRFASCGHLDPYIGAAFSQLTAFIPYLRILYEPVNAVKGDPLNKKFYSEPFIFFFLKLFVQKYDNP